MAKKELLLIKKSSPGSPAQIVNRTGEPKKYSGPVQVTADKKIDRSMYNFFEQAEKDIASHIAATKRKNSITSGEVAQLTNLLNSLTDNQRKALDDAIASNPTSVAANKGRNLENDKVWQYANAIVNLTDADGNVNYKASKYEFNPYTDGQPDEMARKAFNSLSVEDQLRLEISDNGKPKTPKFGDPNADLTAYENYQKALAKVEQEAAAKADADAVKAIEDAYRNNRGDYEYDPKEAARAIKESNKQVTYTQDELVDIYEGLQGKYDWDDEAYAAWNTPAPASNPSHKIVATRNVKREDSPANNPTAIAEYVPGAAAREVVKQNNAKPTKADAPVEETVAPAEATDPYDSQKAYDAYWAAKDAGASDDDAWKAAYGAVYTPEELAAAEKARDDYMRIKGNTAFMRTIAKLTGKDKIEHWARANKEGSFENDVKYGVNQAVQGIGDVVGGVALIAGLATKATIDAATSTTWLVSNGGKPWTMEEARSRFALLDEIMYVAETSGSGKFNAYHEAGKEKASEVAQYVGNLSRSFVSSMTAYVMGGWISAAAPQLTTTFNLADKLGTKAPPAIKTLAKVVPEIQVGVNQIPFLTQSFASGYNEALASGYNQAGALAWGSWTALAEGIPESISWNWSAATGSTVKSQVYGSLNKDAAKTATKKGLKNLMAHIGDSGVVRVLAALNAEGMSEVMTNYLDWIGRKTILKQDVDLPTLRENLATYGTGALLSAITQGFSYAASTPARKQAEAIVDGMVNGQPPTSGQMQQLDDSLNDAAAQEPLNNDRLDELHGEGLQVDEKTTADYRAANDAFYKAEQNATNALARLQQMNANGVPFGSPERVAAVKEYAEARKEYGVASQKRKDAHAKFLKALDGDIQATEAAAVEAGAEQQRIAEEYAEWQYAEMLQNDPQGLVTVAAELQQAVNEDLAAAKTALHQAGFADSAMRTDLMLQVKNLQASNAKLQQMIDEANAAIAPATASEIPADVDVGLTQAFDEASLAADVREVVNKNRDQLKAVDAIAKKYGRKVVMVDTLKGKTISGQTITADVNGYYDPQTGAIYIAADAQEGAFSYFAIHELVHSIKNSDPEGYEALCDTIMEELVNNGEDVDALIDYQQNVVYNGSIDLETAIEEVVANTAPAILTDENYVRSMYEGNRSLFDKIRDFFNELKQAFANLTQYRSWEQGASLGVDSVAKIAEVFDRVAATPDGGGGGGARFSMKEPVERVGNLVAVHSLNAKNAMNAVRNGGMPAASIGIIKKGTQVPNYGPISFVFKRNSIDPEADSRNHVFPGDAYTPMYPGVIETIPESVTAQIERVSNDVQDKMTDHARVQAAKSLESYVWLTQQEMYAAADKDTPVMVMYLVQRGIDADGSASSNQSATRKIRFNGGFKRYHQWLDSVLEGKAGAEKSFYSAEGTMVPATMENIVSYFSSFVEQNGGRMNGSYVANGAEGLFADMAPRLENVEAIRDRANSMASDSVVKNVFDRHRSAYHDVTTDIAREAAKAGAGDSKSLMLAEEVLSSIARSGDFRAASITQAVEESAGFVPTKELVEEINDLLTAIRDTPISYFEAKPERVISIDEVALAIIPNGAEYNQVAAALKKAGIKVARYSGGDSGRANVLNQRAAQLMFSRKDFNRSTRTPATKSQGSLAQQLIAENASRAKESRVTDLLNTARQAMANGNAKAADEAGLAMAREILTNTGAVDTSADSIKTELRGMNIAPTAEERANIAATYGSYDAYRRAVAGVVPLGGVGKQGAISIDQAIGVLQQDSPGQVTGDDRMEWLYQFAQNNPKGKVNYDGDLEADAAELWNQIKRDNSDFFNSSETAPFDVPDFNVKDIKVNKTAAKDWLSKTVAAGATADQVREYASKRRYTELTAKGRAFWNNVMAATAKPTQQDFRMSEDEKQVRDTIHLFQGNSPYTQGNGIQMDHERSTARARRKLSAIRNEVQRIIGFTYNDEYYNGAARRRGATAYFEPAHNFVSSSDTNNMTAFLHEGGHALNMEQLDPDEVQVFLQEMPATFIGQYDLLDRPAEAGAEMFRAWMLNPTSMEQKYPNTFAALRRQIGQRRYNDLREQGNVYRRFLDSTTPEKIEGVLHETTRRQPRDWGQTFRNAVKRTMDKGYGLKKLDRSAISRGINLAGGGADARASQARTASQAVEALFFDGMYDRRGNRVACSLAECVRGLRGEQKMRDFNAYLELTQALDRYAANNQDWVFSNDVCTVAEARSFVARIAREQQDIVEAASNVWEWLKTYRDTQLSTAISQEVKDRWEELNPHYIPQTRNFTLDISGAVHGGGVGGQGTGVNGRRVGSTRDIVSPIDAIANMVARTKSAALQHDVLKTLQEYYDRDRGGVIGQFIHEIDPQRVPHVVPADVIRRAATNTLEGVGLAGEDLQLIDDLLNANLEDDVTFETRTPNGRVGNAFAITENGVTRYYEIHDQDLLDALTHMPAPQLGAVLGSSKTVTGFISSLITAKNPAFALGNAVRDAQEAYFTGSAQNPFVFAWDYLGALVDVVGNRDVVRQYRAMGGSSGLSSVYADGKSVDDLKRAMFGAAGDNRNAAKLAFDRLGDAIETFNGAIETVPRLAEYKRQLRRGAAYADAIKAAKNCTTDFSSGGSATAPDKALWRFFNASMQSTYKAANMFVDGAASPQSRRRLASQMTAAVTIGVVGRALAEILLQANDDDDTYAAMPEYTKDSYWIIPTNEKGKFVKIPLPNGVYMSTINSLGRRIGLAAMGIKDGGEVGELLGEQATGLLMDVLKGISPFGEFNVGNPMGSNFVFNPLIQTWTNTDWTGAPIVPASMEGLSPELQYDDKTTDVAKVIGKVFNMSPMKVDNLISQNSGVIGEVNEALTVAKNDGVGAGIKEFFLSRFMVDTAYSQQVTSGFYDEKERLQQLIEDVEETQKRGEQPYSPIFKDLNPKQARQAAAEAKELKKKMDSLGKNLSDIGRQATQAANAGDEEKARELRFKQQQLAAEATLAAANFFDKWNNLNK